MDLYIPTQQPSLEKSAAEVSLPEDANAWPTEIMQELYKQVPYIADFDPQVVMDKVDAERGYGFGHVEVQNRTEMQNGASPDQKKQVGVQQVRVPVIIKERKLQPLDVLITASGKALPLTENRLRQALFRPQAFDVTGKTPGDQSMVGQLYPPYRSNMGFGGGGAAMGKEGSARIQPGDHLHDGGHSFKLEAHHLTGFDPKSAEKRAPMHWNISADGSITPKTKTASDDQFHAKLEKVLGLTPEQTAKLKGQKTAAAMRLPNAATSAPVHNVKGITPNLSKTASILEAILPTIRTSDYVAFTDHFQDRGLQAAFAKNAHATGAAVKTLLEFEPQENDKTASALDALTPSVVQVRKETEGYSVKQAHHMAWAPVSIVVDRGEIVRSYGEKVALAADLTGSVTLSDGEAAASPEENRAELVSSFGVYKVEGENGEELQGFVFPNLYDVDGTALPLALFTDGQHAAVQASILGERITGDAPPLPLGGQPQGHGCFVRVLEGAAEATIPMTVKGGYASGGAQQYQVETFDGRQMMLSVQSGGALKVPQQIDDTFLVPADYQWMSLGEKQDVALVDEKQPVKQAAWGAFQPVTVRAGTEDSFSLQGDVLGKFASSFLSLDDALFLLGGAGVDLDYASRKLAEAVAHQGPVLVKVARPVVSRDAATRVRELQKEASPELRVDLVKEAAFIPDPVAVDTVLSLGFINPDNMQTFVSFLPQIETVLSKLSELLVASRLGLQDIPVFSLEKAVKTLEEVCDGLKVVAFQKS